MNPNLPTPGLLSRAKAYVKRHSRPLERDMYEVY